MNGQGSKAQIFDVFLSYNSKDKQAVREIAGLLFKEGIKPWLDVEQMQPGTSLQAALGWQIKNIRSAAVFIGDGGLGPWQDHEMQSFLDRFVNRKCAVIPVILPTANATPELPWLLDNLHRVDFRTDSHPLRRLIWGITGQKPAELAEVHDSEKPATIREAINPRLIAGRVEQAKSDNVISETRLYPPLREPPDPDNVTQLRILRNRVMEYWVDGLLKDSLYNEVLISLGNREIDNAVPWKYTAGVVDATNSAPLNHPDVLATYDAKGLLLILGEPGSGKTTTLVDLARSLLERAKANIKERVPIVVNLSSWKKKQPLAEWVAIELSEKYWVPKKIGDFWLERDYLLPLLDGLDEIETSMQPDCVAAINTFIEEFEPSGLVVCCRLNEYRWLPKRLKLNGAICIEPLSSEEVSEFLAAGGPKLAALQKAVDGDPVLQELAETPLMLSIMSLAFQEASGNELASQKVDSPEARRKQIFQFYVEGMFKRKGMASLVFPKKKIVGWLWWLARKMRGHSQSVFLVEKLQPSWLGGENETLTYVVEELQPSWLDGENETLTYGILVTLSLGLVFAIIFGLVGGVTAGLFFGLTIVVGIGLGHGWSSSLANGISSGLIGWLPYGLLLGLNTGIIAGLFFGLILWLMFAWIFRLKAGQPLVNSVTIASRFGRPAVAFCGLIGWFADGLINGQKGELRVGLCTCLSVGLIGGLGLGSLEHITLMGSIDWNRFWKKLVPGLILGISAILMYRLDETVIGGMTGGLIVWTITGLAVGLTIRVKALRELPNQGIHLCGKISSIVYLMIAFLTAPLIGLLIGEPSKKGLYLGLIGGLYLGLIGWLNQGGSAVIKHYALRLTLWLNGHTALNLIKFLDQCAKLIFLKKVGGGYIFIHRMLLDYFADLPQSAKGEHGKTEPGTP